MICPNCSQKIERGEATCPLCGVALREKGFRPLRALIIALSWIIALSVFGVGVYKLYFWIDTYKLTKLYTRGAYRPTISEITLEDGRVGHAIAFYGKDGDKIFIEDLDKTIEFTGGVARLRIPDSYWFGPDIESVESADVSVSAILIRETGDRRRLPPLNFTIDAPESPITVISPKSSDLAVNTSIYPLEVQVVPGSTVTVNGDDATDIVDRTGLLSKNVNVFPIGNNEYTIIVKTPGHKETRRDILIYRAEMEIAVEVDSAVKLSTSSDIVTIFGKCEPNATISVDTPFVAGSIVQDMEAGTYSFIAQMSTIGDNTVRFRASKEGKADSVISLTIDYLPSIDVYSRKAQKMDYKNLCLLFERWTGKIFRCDGEVIDVFVEEDRQYIVMDVGPDGEQQLIILENLSGIGTPTRGKSYTAWADVLGRRMYNTNYYPELAVRYMDVMEEN